ncbi:MAG TPA: electron transfer flavoprotein subunit alpha/FixB family protein [Gemmatimonadales bacterium]|nr:electron transfer flavoprotein subunit alpha/FixB family protein [Gemmatimonadales bacterium]
MANVLAVLEQRDGSLKRVSAEVLTAARRLADAAGGEVHALALGPAGLDLGEAGRFGADKVFHAAGDAARLYQPDLWTAAVADRARAGAYEAVLVSATALGKDLAPRLAARLALPLVADAIDLTRAQGIVATRPVYAGKALSRVRVTAPSCVVSIRPNSVTPVEQRRAGAVEAVALPAGGSPAARTVRVKEPERAALDVAEASIIVSGGRGLKDPSHFQLLEELVQAFGGGAAVGASRAVVDAGWRPHAEQVGQTGKTVSPNLYIAVGISGAIQHLAGMRTAKVIVAINKDKDAPIFKVADYGIVGDLFEVVPRLTEEIRKTRGN